MNRITSSHKDLVLISIAFPILFYALGCTSVLVQPYDEKLLSDTEAFFKKAATIIEEGRRVSPLSDTTRNDIGDPENHPAHYSAFEKKYDELLIDVDALIIRALASSEKIDAFGRGIQEKVTKLFEEELPSNCEDLASHVGHTSLTARSYIDLKCLVLQWKTQHSSEGEFTGRKQILKKANWEGRNLGLFNAILAIQKAEAFKNNKKQEEEG